MASNKRGRHLDQPTRDHLAGIEAALEAMRPKPRQPDEFTTNELRDRLSQNDNGITYAAVSKLLNRMVQDGKCEKRLLSIDGNLTNLYRMVRPDAAP